MAGVGCCEGPSFLDRRSSHPLQLRVGKSPIADEKGRSHDGICPLSNKGSAFF